MSTIYSAAKQLKQNYHKMFLLIIYDVNLNQLYIFRPLWSWIYISVRSTISNVVQLPFGTVHRSSKAWPLHMQWALLTTYIYVCIIYFNNSWLHCLILFLLVWSNKSLDFSNDFKFVPSFERKRKWINERKRNVDRERKWVDIDLSGLTSKSKGIFSVIW